MKKRLKFINIFAILISLLIIFLSFSLNVNADDEITADVYYDFDVEKTDDYTTANVRIIDNENNYTLVEGTDYTISYINNDVVGMAEFSINILNSNYILNDYSYSFNIYDKIIKVYDDYGIDIYNLAIELEDNYASIDSIFSNLLADYGDYVEVTNTEATTSTDIYSQIRVTGDYSVLLIIKGDYGTNDITISEGNAFDFTWHARNIVITEADLNNRLIVTGLENQGYYNGQSYPSTWAGTLTFNDTELVEGTDYTFTVNILDDEEMIHYYNDTESGISSSDADGSIYYGNVSIEFNGNYYGNLKLIYKLCPSIANASIELTDDAIMDGDNYKFQYGLAYLPLNIKMEINGINKTLTYGTDFI